MTEQVKKKSNKKNKSSKIAKVDKNGKKIVSSKKKAVKKKKTIKKKKLPKSEEWLFGLDKNEVEKTKIRRIQKDADLDKKDKKKFDINLEKEPGDVTMTHTRRQWTKELEDEKFEKKKEKDKNKFLNEPGSIVCRLGSIIVNIGFLFCWFIFFYHLRFGSFFAKWFCIEWNYSYKKYLTLIEKYEKSVTSIKFVTDFLEKNGLNDLPSIIIDPDFIMMLPGLLIIYILFFYIPLIIWGKCLGKKIFGLRLMSIHGRELKGKKIFLREFIYKPFLFFGIVLSIVTKSHRAIHDLLSDSIVIKYDKRVFTSLSRGHMDLGKEEI